MSGPGWASKTRAQILLRLCQQTTSEEEKATREGRVEEEKREAKEDGSANSRDMSSTNKLSESETSGPHRKVRQTRVQFHAPRSLTTLDLYSNSAAAS